MVTLHEVITFLVSMQISISSLQTHNVNRCGRSRHLARKLSLRRKRSSPNVFEMAATETITSIILIKLIRVSLGTVRHPRRFKIVVIDIQITLKQMLRDFIGIDRKSGSAGMPRPTSYAVFCLKKKRGLAKGNTDSATRSGHGAGTRAPGALDRVRQVAIRDKEARFTALLHHVTVESLRTAYLGLRPQAAPGVDGTTWKAYGQDLEANLQH